MTEPSSMQKILDFPSGFAARFKGFDNGG